MAWWRSERGSRPIYETSQSRPGKFDFIRTVVVIIVIIKSRERNSGVKDAISVRGGPMKTGLTYRFNGPLSPSGKREKRVSGFLEPGCFAQDF